MEPDIPECNAPRLGTDEHVVRLVGPENTIADLVIVDIKLVLRQIIDRPDGSVGERSVGGGVRGDVIGLSVEGLDSHVVVVVALERILDQYIAAADEIHAVGVHDPADLLDVVDMHARASDDLERPVRRVAQQDALDLETVAVEGFDLRLAAVTVILLRRTEDAPPPDRQVAASLGIDAAVDQRPLVEIDRLIILIENLLAPHIMNAGTEISYVGTRRDRRVGQVGQDEEVLHPVVVELHRNLLRGIVQFELDAVRGLHVGHDAVRKRTNLHFRKRPRTAGHTDLQRSGERIGEHCKAHVMLDVPRSRIGGIVRNFGIVHENLFPASVAENLHREIVIGRTVVHGGQPVVGNRRRSVPGEIADHGRKFQVGIVLKFRRDRKRVFPISLDTRFLHGNIILSVDREAELQRRGGCVSRQDDGLADITSRAVPSQHDRLFGKFSPAVSGRSVGGDPVVHPGNRDRDTFAGERFQPHDSHRKVSHGPLHPDRSRNRSGDGFETAVAPDQQVGNRSGHVRYPDAVLRQSDPLRCRKGQIILVRSSNRQHSIGSRLYPKRCERRGGCRRDGLRNNAFTDQADTVGIGGLRSHGLRYGPHHSHSARNQVRIARGVGAGG